MPQLGKYVVLVTALTRRWTFVLALLHWTWVCNCKGAPVPINNFSVCCSPVRLLNSSPIVYQVRWSRDPSLGQQLKSWGARHVYKLFPGDICSRLKWEHGGHVCWLSVSQGGIMVSPWTPAIRQWLLKCAIGIFQEKIGRYAFLSCSPSELGIWGAHPSDGCLKIRDARCGVRALQFSEAWNW